MDGVVCAAPTDGSFEVPGLVLRPGTSLIVHIPRRDDGLPPLCDVASGLVTPERGSVRFLGEDWGQTGAFRQSVMRGRIGRVFSGQAWVSNLSVSENVLLPQRHHTHRPEKELLGEAAALAAAFGLPELPAARPESLRPHDLVRWQWVRAFLGGPRLLLLEEPESGVWEEHVPLLRDRTLRLASEGCAALWITHDDRAWRDVKSPAVLHASIADGKLSAGLETK